MTISPSPILGDGDTARMNNKNNNNEASFGLDVSQMNNLMPPTTVKKNLLLTKMSGQQSPVVKCADPAPVAAARTPVAVSAPTPTTTMCTGLMKTQAKPLGVGARVMRALDCLKKEDAPNAVNDRRDALHALLKMVQSEYAAFKPFVTLLAPTCVKVAEMDSDGVCRFYARRVLFQAFQSASYDESAIVDAVTSLVPIFVDQTTQTSLRCLKLLLEKVASKESMEKILDLVGSYVYEKAGVSSTSSSSVKKQACECVAIALSKLCDEKEEERELFASLDALLKRDLYSLNVFGQIEKKVIVALAAALKNVQSSGDRACEDDGRVPPMSATNRVRLVRV